MIQQDPIVNKYIKAFDKLLNMKQITIHTL